MKLSFNEKARDLNCGRALSVSIFEDKSIGNCSNNGISARFREVLILNAEGNVKVDMDNPPENLCVYVERELFGERHDYIRPYADAVGAGWMFGGSLVYSCDSRFGYMPMKLHDRQESWELNERLSR